MAVLADSAKRGIPARGRVPPNSSGPARSGARRVGAVALAASARPTDQDSAGHGRFAAQLGSPQPGDARTGRETGREEVKWSRKMLSANTFGHQFVGSTPS